MTITQMNYTQAIVHLWTQSSPFEIYYLWSSMFNLVCITAKYPRGTFIIFSVISKISHFPIMHYLINKCTITTSCIIPIFLDVQYTTTDDHLLTICQHGFFLVNENYLLKISSMFSKMLEIPAYELGQFSHTLY